MKPAPPGTHTLSGWKLMQHLSQVLPPMDRRGGDSFARRGGIEHAEWRAFGARGIFGGCNRYDGRGARKKSAGERLFLNGDGKIVPARYAKIGPVIDAGGRLPLHEAPDCRGETPGPGRRTDLIADHVDLLALAHQPQHGEHEVASRGRVDPRRAQ